MMKIIGVLHYLKTKLNKCACQVLIGLESHWLSISDRQTNCML